MPAVQQGGLTTERKFAAGENKSAHRSHMNMKKLDEETEEFQRECPEMPNVWWLPPPPPFDSHVLVVLRC